MAGTMNLATAQTFTESSFLEEMIHRLGSHTSYSASLDIEMNEVPFHVSAKGDSAVISFDRILDAIKFFRNFTPVSKNPRNSVEMVNNVMKKLSLTLYIQNRHFGVLGPKANPVYSMLLSFLFVLR